MRVVARAPLLALVLLAALAPAAGHAQDFERRLPQPPPQPPAPEVPVAPEQAAPAADSTQVLPMLRGVLFVDSPGALQPAGVAPETVAGQIEARGLPLLADPAFTDKVRPYLGRPLTMGDLNAITRLVQDAYGATDRPFVDVSVPPQNVERGVVQVVVTEFRLGAVSVTGNEYYSSETILGMSDLEAGETLTLPRLRDALYDYNSDPFLTVNAVVRPGAATGTTDLVLEAEDRLPLRVYAGYDNQGVPTLGRDEWYAGFNWGNLFGGGEILSYQYTESFEERYHSHSGSFVAPISSDDRIIVFGAYAQQTPLLASVFRSEGHSWQVSARFVHDLSTDDGVRSSFQLGADFKRTDNNLDFFGFRVLDNSVDVVQFPLIYTATIDDRIGQTVFQNLLVISPGGLSQYNEDIYLRQLVPFGDTTYIYDRASITRTTWFENGFSWIVRGMLQLATGNLPYSEQLAGGGIGSVRGYDPNAALGSEGVLLSSEILAPAFRPFGLTGEYEDELQFGLFVNYASVWQHRRFPDSPRNAELASAGISANLSIGRHFDLEIGLGHQLIRAPFRLDRDTRAAIVATVGF